MRTTGRISNEREDFAARNLPAPAYYATGLAMATGVNWIIWKMAHSQRCHKLFPIPQALAITGNLYGFHTNRRGPV